MRCWFGVLHGAVFWCECIVAPEANPLWLPLLCGLVEGRRPFHVSGRQFSPRCVVLWVLVIDKN